MTNVMASGAHTGVDGLAICATPLALDSSNHTRLPHVVSLHGGSYLLDGSTAHSPALMRFPLSESVTLSVPSSAAVAPGGMPPDTDQGAASTGSAMPINCEGTLAAPNSSLSSNEHSAESSVGAAAGDGDRGAGMASTYEHLLGAYEAVSQLLRAHLYQHGPAQSAEHGILQSQLADVSRAIAQLRALNAAVAASASSPPHHNSHLAPFSVPLHHRAALVGSHMPSLQPSSEPPVSSLEC